MNTPTPPHQSETSKHRELFLPYIPKCNVLDIGFGGDPIVPWAVACDMAQGSYTHVGDTPQQLGFDCRSLPFKDGTLDCLYQSHVIEDFSYADQVKILLEWKRCLRSGGVICLLLPDQKRFEDHCAATGQPTNEAHVEKDMSLTTFKSRVWPQVRGDMAWVEGRDLDDYSFMAVIRRI
jgi:SAM-dependent methyltransferase